MIKRFEQFNYSNIEKITREDYREDYKKTSIPFDHDLEVKITELIHSYDSGFGIEHIIISNSFVEATAFVASKSYNNNIHAWMNNDYEFFVRFDMLSKEKSFKEYYRIDIGFGTEDVLPLISEVMDRIYE